MAAKNGLVRLSLLTFIWRPHVSARVIFVNVRGEIGNVARSLAREGGSRGGGGGPPAEDVLKLVEDELHRLVLENHVHRHVAVVALGPQQRGPEDDADVLRCHAVGV